MKLDALVNPIKLDAVQPLEEVELIPRTAKLPVGRELQPDFFLFSDGLFDLAVFDRTQGAGRDLPTLMSGPRLLHRRRPQQAADMVGAERRRGPLHRFPPVGALHLVFLVVRVKLSAGQTRFSKRRELV